MNPLRIGSITKSGYPIRHGLLRRLRVAVQPDRVVDVKGDQHGKISWRDVRVNTPALASLNSKKELARRLMCCLVANLVGAVG